MKAPSYAEAHTDIGSFKTQWESDGVRCAACLPYLEKLRTKFQGFKDENNRLMSQLHSISDWMRLAEKVKLSSDKMAVAGFLSLCSSTNQVHTAAVKHSLRPEAFHNHEDSYLAVISTTLSEQIARTEKEWKILAGMYNELVERIQQSERMLSDVQIRNSQLEIVNAELLNLVSYSQSSSQEVQGFPSFDEMMHQASSTKSNLHVPLVPVPAECMYGKIPTFFPEICKGSLNSSPISTSEHNMDIVCKGNISGSVNASPVSVLGQSFDVQDSAYYKSPASLRGGTHAIRSKEEVAYSGGDGDEYWRSDLFHAQEIQPPDEAAEKQGCNNRSSRDNFCSRSCTRSSSTKSACLATFFPQAL